MPSQFREDIFDLSVAADVAGQGDIRVALLGEAFDTLFEFLALVGKGQVRALCVHRLGNAPRNRPIAGNAHDEYAFVLQKTHNGAPFVACFETFRLDIVSQHERLLGQ